MFISKLTKLITIIVIIMATTTYTYGKEAKQKSTTKTTLLTVFKSAQCGCCNEWIKHINDQGITTTTENRDNLSEIKNHYKIHPQLRSCHTGISEEGFIFEGHIPAKFIKRFLTEKPKGYRGLSVPGMPTGSPGMEYDAKFVPYKIYALKTDGSVEVYAEVNSAKEQF